MRPPQQREAQLAAGQPARQPQTCITASFRSPTSTQRPPKSIRHPATLDNAPNLLKIQGSNEGTAFRGDQTAGLPLKASTKKNISFFFFFFFLRGGLGKAGGHSTPRARCLCSAHTARPPLGQGGVWPSFERSWCQCCCEGRGHSAGQPGHDAAWPRGFVQRWPV